MKKQQTLAEMTAGMNEFEKFLFFRRKATDLDTLTASWRVLIMFCDIYTPEIIKRLRISRHRWNEYVDGIMPLPEGFLQKFEEKFRKELKEGRKKKSEKQLGWYLGLSRDSLRKGLKNADGDIAHSDCSPVNSAQ